MEQLEIKTETISEDVVANILARQPNETKAAHGERVIRDLTRVAIERGAEARAYKDSFHNLVVVVNKPRKPYHDYIGYVVCFALGVVATPFIGDIFFKLFEHLR